MNCRDPQHRGPGVNAFCHVKEARLSRPLEDSLSMTFWKKQDCRDRRQISSCQKLRKEELTRKGPRRSFWGQMGPFHISTVVVVRELYASVRTHFTVCKSSDLTARQKPDPCPPPHLHLPVLAALPEITSPVPLLSLCPCRTLCLDVPPRISALLAPLMLEAFT